MVEEKPTVNQAENKLLGKNLVKMLCLYSLFEARLIGPIIARLINIYEDEEYEYLELINNKKTTNEDEEKFQKEYKRKQAKEDNHCTYAILNKNRIKSNYNDAEIEELEENKEALVLHISPAPVYTIPLFTPFDYQYVMNKYTKFPYVLEFLDYVISKKANENNYKTRIQPRYSKFELDDYLNEFLALKQKSTLDEQPYDNVIKTLTKEID